MISTVLFDLYGTLVDIHTDEGSYALWRSMAGFYGKNGAKYTPKELREAYFGAVSAREGEALRNDAHEAHPEIRIEDVFLELFTKKGVSADADLAVRAGERFRKRSTQYIRLYPGAEELLDALKAAGKKVVLLSNAQRIFTESEMRSLGIWDRFDAVYISSDHGVKKPDRRFFELCIREQGVEAEETVMVGNDGVCDIRGARAVGLRTIYIRSNISPDEPTPEADWALEEMDLGRVQKILLDTDLQ